MKLNNFRPSSPPTASSQSGKSQSSPIVLRLLKHPGSWIVGIIVIAFSILGHQTQLASQRFNNGEAAYNAGNCDEALTHFGQLLNGRVPIDMDDWQERAKARSKECDRFNRLIASSAEQPPVSNILAATSFLERYPKSPVRSQLSQIVTTQADGVAAADLATVAMCKRLPSVMNQQLLPNAHIQRPLMLQACGDTYSTAQNFDRAIETYEAFLDRYAEHEQTKAVQVAMAKAMVEQAKTQDTGEIPPPPLSGYTGNGTTVVKIRNDSPESMRIVLSGTDPQFQELGPCEDCETFKGTPPSSCPEKGPEAEFVLTPGQYDVIVRSTGNRSITPFTGTWALGQGHKYYNCFYLVQTPIGS